MDPGVRAILFLAIATGLTVGAVPYLEQQRTFGSVPGANCTLLVCPPAVSLSLQSYHFNSLTNVTLTIKNTGVLYDALINYVVTDTNGNQWWRIWLPPNQSTTTWWRGPALPPDTTGTAMLTISSACGNCTYRGSAGAFSQFLNSTSYTVTVVTGRDYQFTFTMHT